MAAGSLAITTQKKRFQNRRSCHAVSAETQTLEKTASDVMSYHDMSSENDEWAMRVANPKGILSPRENAEKDALPQLTAASDAAVESENVSLNRKMGQLRGWVTMTF